MMSVEDENDSETHHRLVVGGTHLDASTHRPRLCSMLSICLAGRERERGGERDATMED